MKHACASVAVCLSLAFPSYMLAQASVTAGAAANGAGSRSVAGARIAAARQEPAGSAMKTVLVLPFENTGRASGLSWLGEGLAELSARRLGGANRLVLPRSEWLEAAERLGLGPSPRISRASLLKIAREADADYLVFGRFVAEGGRLKLTAQGMRLDGPELSRLFEQSGASDQLVQTHARLCWQLLEFFSAGKRTSQKEYLQQARPLRLDAFESYSRGLLATGTERVRLLREAARLEPEWADPAFALGQTFVEAANYDSALIWLSRVPPASAFGLEAGFYAGVCHLLRNDAPRAEAAFRALIERPWYTNGATGLAARRMDLPEVLNNLAIALSRQGKWGEAKALWEQLRGAAPVEATFAFNLALGAYRAGDNEAAIAAMREALSLRADDATRALLALLLERAGNKAEAEVVRAACETAGCDPSEEIKALAAGSAAVELARLDRISTTLDLVTWYLTGEGREPAGGNGGGARRPEHEEESD